MTAYLQMWRERVMLGAAGQYIYPHQSGTSPIGLYYCPLMANIDNRSDLPLLADQQSVR